MLCPTSPAHSTAGTHSSTRKFTIMAHYIMFVLSSPTTSLPLNGRQLHAPSNFLHAQVLADVLARTSPRSPSAQKANALAGAAHLKHLPGTVVAQPRTADKPRASGPALVAQAGPPRAARVTFAGAAPATAAHRAADASANTLAPVVKQVAPSRAAPRVACASLPQARVAHAASPVTPMGAQMAPIRPLKQVPPPGAVPGAACASAARAAGGVVDAEVLVRQGRRLLMDAPAWDEKPEGVSQGESPPDIVAQLRALSPFAALTQIPIADS